MSTRRAFLRGVLGVAGAGVAGAGPVVALAGCDLMPGGGNNDPRADPLEGLLVATVALGDRYDLAIAAVPMLAPTLTPLREAHQAHARALADALGSAVPQASASPAPMPVDRARAVAALATAEKAARDEAVAACLAASPRMAALLGCVAAARASHLEILK